MALPLPAAAELTPASAAGPADRIRRPSAAQGTSAPDRAGAALAATIWRAYRRDGGTRDRVVGDFVIGAHAAIRADRLLTRDRGFYRERFGDLRIVDPAT